MFNICANDIPICAILHADQENGNSTNTNNEGMDTIMVEEKTIVSRERFLVCDLRGHKHVSPLAKRNQTWVKQITCFSISFLGVNFSDFYLEPFAFSRCT